MASKNYTLSPNAVEVYPSILSRYLLYGILAFEALTFLGIIGILFSAGISNLDMGSIITQVILLLMFSLLAFIAYFRMTTRIVIDNSEQTVYRKTVFGNRHLGHFNDVANVSKVTVAGPSANYYYSLKFKTDVYGKGIALTTGHVKPHHKRFKEFEAEVLPVLNNYLKEKQDVAPVHEPSFDYFSTKPIFYKQKGDVFYFYSINYWNYLVGVVLLIVSIINLNSEFRSEHPFHTDGSGMMIYLFVVGMVMFLLGSNKTVINTLDGFLAREHVFGLVKSRYLLSDFLRFSIVRKSTNFIYSGTDVRAEFGGAKPKSVALKTFSKTQKIDSFIRETETIIHN